MKGALKGMILSELLTGEKTSNFIYENLVSNEYEFEMPDGSKQKFTYDGTKNNIHVGLLYLRNHKFIKIVNKKIPYSYAITKLGKNEAENPFRYLEYMEKAVKTRKAELEAEFDNRVETEAENRIEDEIRKIHNSNAEIIGKKAKEIAHSVVYDGNKVFGDAVDQKATQLLTQEYIPKGTKLFIGKDNVIELNMTSDPKYPHPTVVVVENGKITNSYVKE